MDSNQYTINLLTDDFSAEELDHVIRVAFPQDEVAVVATQVFKSGRAGDNLIDLVFSQDMAVNLLANVVFVLFKYAIGKMSKIFNSKPAVVITLVDDSVIELPKTLSDTEVQKRILEALEKSKVKSIEFLS